MPCSAAWCPNPVWLVYFDLHLFVHRKAASWFPAVRGYCVLVLYALFFIFFRGLGIEQPDLFVRRCLCFLYSLPSGLAAELS